MHRLVFVALAIIAYYYLKSLFRGEPSLPRDEGSRVQDITDEMMEDPVCGVYIPRGSAIQRTIDGKRYFFCGPRCAENYETKTSSGKG